GSSNVVHLHGEITKSRSTLDESLVYTINGAELKIGDTCEKGSQLRPHLVWFGEEVPMIEIACRIVSKADIFVVIGSSLLVYPAAGLIDYAPHAIPKFIIDPEIPPVNHLENLIPIEATAVAGVKILIKHLEKLRD
ncbi:MAG: SIR2 family NAD-dependent protein deacylase, partial [Bacteroidota bacterium]